MEQELRHKTRLLNFGFNNNSGQAVVEYILILMISISMVVALKNVFTSFDKLIQSYAGDYLTCLMDYGELPSLGYDESELAQHKDASGNQCNPRFSPFSLTEGRPPVGASGSGASSKSSKSSKEGESSSNTNSGGGGESARSRRGGSDSSGRGSRVGGLGSGDSGFMSAANNNRVKRTSDGVASSNVKLIEEDEEGGMSSYARSPRETRIIYRNRGPRYIAITGKMLDNYERQTSRFIPRGAATRSIAGIQEEAYMTRAPRKGPPPEKPTPKKIDDSIQEGNWSFGNIFKWLIIISIIVMIVVFFGGQFVGSDSSD